MRDAIAVVMDRCCALRRAIAEVFGDDTRQRRFQFCVAEGFANRPRRENARFWT